MPEVIDLEPIYEWLYDHYAQPRLGRLPPFQEAFNVPKAFGHGKDRIYEDLTVISASKDGNNIILMDKNRSFYELPRDSVLEGYNKQQEKQHKAEIKRRNSNRIDIER